MASQLEQLLTCCICLDRFRNPKLLPCQHSVCMEPCMEGLVDYVRRQVKCPECRAEHRIPYNGVQGFPSNVTLQRFLEAHIEITGEAPDPFTGQIMERCGVCNEKNYLTICAHCEKKICADCKAAHSDILKREIGRINNQVKRACHRLDDQLSILQRNIQALKTNSDSVKEEIDNIDKRLQKAIRDRCESLRNEVISYYNTELRNLTLLKEGLEQEISNVDANSELVDKHMDDQTPWDDNELMDTKDIFLKTMEFIRSFDYDAGDYNRRARFLVPDDLNKIASTLSNLGELAINNPKQTLDGFTTGVSSLQTGLGLGLGLSKSKSDHRLAAQFRDQEDNYGYSGRISPVARRKFGDRPQITEEQLESSNDVGRRRFRSRFMRREEEDERLVRFNDEDQQQQQKSRPKVIDTEDVSRGPLSGIVRLSDSPRVIQRLQEKEGNFKKKKEEPPKPVTPPAAPKTPVTFGTPRKTNRQLSEDEIDKIKKQNKSEVTASSSGATNSPTASTQSKPSFERVTSIKDTERSTRSDRPPSSSPRSGTLSPSTSVQEESPSRKTSRDNGSNKYEYGSGATSHKPTTESKTHSFSRSSSTSSVGESGKSTTGTSKTTRPTSTSSYEKRNSRSDSTDSNKSVEESTRSTGTDRFQKTPSVENKSTPATPRTSGASRYQSRFMPRAGTPSAETAKASVNDEEDEEEETSEESETEDSDESSEEEEEETVKSSYTRPSGSILLGRSTTSNKTTNDSGYGSSGNNSKYGGTSSSSESNASYRKPSYTEPLKSPKESSEEIESKYPYASKFLNRSRTTTANNEEDAKPSFQSRFLSKSKSSAVLGPDTNNDDETHIPSSTGTSRAKFEELKERRQRLARSKSSAGMEEDESTSKPETSTYRSRFGRDADSSASSGNSTRGTGNASAAAASGSEDAPSNQLSNWARYLKNKYGNKAANSPGAGAASGGSSSSSVLGNKATSPTSPTSRSIARSRSSHLLGFAKENDSSEDDSKNVHATPTSPVAGTLGPTPFGNLHRSQYLQKQQLLFKIGSRGSEPGNFTWPRGIAIGPDDSIVVADSSNHRVQVFDKDGNYLKDFGSYGNGDGEFDCLAGVSVNRIGQYIIADRYNHRIQIFDPSGMFLRSFGSQGSSDGKFSYPWGVTTDSLGFIYVCDKENHRIQVFQSDGTFVGKFGSLGSKVGQLEHPHYIAVSSTNKVIVSDSNNHRIQIFDINGKVLTAFGSEGSEEGQFKFPRGVAVDEQGYIFVADSGNNRIQIFHPDGAFLRAFGCWGSGDGEFKGLEGVGVMSNGNILICDRENHRVQVF
ncbi:UNVERIFIED_CONTAM: hypothetical protein RMT77_009117 [Armadillidium vulgare]